MIEIAVHGKCILLGEHSVVRGRPALVFPLQSKQLRLRLKKSAGSGVEIAAGEYAEPFRLALGRALELRKARLEGKWVASIDSDIPVRAGLGSSAALSVATVRFLEAAGIFTGDAFELALELENIFHGKSSGIDVAAALADGPIRFTRGEPAEALAVSWRPRLYLADTGLRSSTKECVEKVMALNRPDLDERMAETVRHATKALAQPEESGRAALAQAMNQAAEIFRQWDLVPLAVEKKIWELKEAGALAVKPTGSGQGGYVISLWETTPPAEMGLTPVLVDS